MTVRRLRAPVVALILFALAPTAGAADSPATALLRQGIAMRRDHRNEDALALFQAATRLDPSPCAVAQVGLAQQALSRWLEAESSLTAALARDDDPWIQRHRAVLEGALSTVGSHLGWVEVEAGAPDATIVIDRREARVDQGPMRAVAGVVPFVVRAPYYRDLTSEATVSPRATTRVALTLESVPPSPEVPSARVDGVAPGAVAAGAGSPGAVAETSPIHESRAPTGPWVVSGPLLVGGAVAAGIGTWFGLRALDETRTRDEHCSGQFCDRVGLEADHDARVAATAATIGFGVATGAILSGVAWVVLAGPRSPVRVGPTLGRANGFVVTGAL